YVGWPSTGAPLRVVVMSPNIWSCVEFSLLMKMTCLMAALSSPAFDGIGLLLLPPSWSVSSCSANPLVLLTRAVYGPNWSAPGTGMTFTVPSVADFGDPWLSGGTVLFGPAPRPFALAT